LRPKCRHVFALIAVVLLVSATVEAQTRSSSVTLTGTVSETIALSTPPNFDQRNLDMEVVSSGGNTLRITLSGRDSKSPVIRVPLLVRSNSGFKISAGFESQTAELLQLSVIDAHPTGTLVLPHVVNGLKARSLLNPDISQPLLVLTGPRVSLGGTLASPNNALQLTLLIRLQAPPTRDWLVNLTLVGSPESRVQ
jgi:hypothetical protein